MYLNTVIYCLDAVIVTLYISPHKPCIHLAIILLHHLSKISSRLTGMTVNHKDKKKQAVGDEQVSCLQVAQL